jgi:uncharacterized membrane protein YfcA
VSLTPKLVAVGLLAGFSSGIFGIGGGTVMVPLLVFVAAFDQHRAHATSLAAGIFLGAAGGVTYAVVGDVDLLVGALLAAGALVGAPLGARLMHAIPADRLKVAFGLLLMALSIVMVLG